jgi:hypothetical protein
MRGAAHGWGEECTRALRCIQVYKSPNILSHLEFDIIWLEMHILEVQ